MSAIRPPRKWTAERVEMLRAEYATSTDDMALLYRLNTLPGPPIASKSAVQMMAFDLKLSKNAPTLKEIQRRTGLTSRGRKTSARRTPQREALVREEYATSSDPQAFLDRVNALPGPPLASINALRQWVFMMGLRKDPRVIAETKARVGRINLVRAHAAPRAYEKKASPFVLPALPVPPMCRRRPVVERAGALQEVLPYLPPPTLDMSASAQAARADAAMERKHQAARFMIAKNISAEKIRTATGLPLREVFRLVAQMRT